LQELDIWRTAQILIDSHGEDASTQAAMREDYALEDGNLAAVSVWRRVMLAVEELQRQKSDGPLN
jgi:hypothetical protein